MKNRYGFDGLGVAMVVLAWVLCRIPYGALVSLLLLVLALLRALSTHVQARQSEAIRFANLTRNLRHDAQTLLWRLRGAWHRFRNRWTYLRQYKEFTCKSCGQKLRVPRGKGKLRVTCKSCHAQFSIKS